jgi:hypothetical protein
VKAIEQGGTERMPTIDLIINRRYTSRLYLEEKHLDLDPYSKQICRYIMESIRDLRIDGMPKVVCLHVPPQLYDKSLREWGASERVLDVYVECSAGRWGGCVLCDNCVFIEGDCA